MTVCASKPEVLELLTLQYIRATSGIKLNKGLNSG